MTWHKVGHSKLGIILENKVHTSNYKLEKNEVIEGCSFTEKMYSDSFYWLNQAISLSGSEKLNNPSDNTKKPTKFLTFFFCPSL